MSKLSDQQAAALDEITAEADRDTFERQLTAFTNAAVAKHRATHRGGAAGNAEADRRFGSKEGTR